MAQQHIPEEIGQYRIEKKLGEGGMGMVLLGVHKLLGSKAAIKTLLAGGALEDEEGVRRLMDEGRALASLRHHNIVGVHDLMAEGQSYYLIMEYVSGKPLDQVLKGRTLTILEALDFAIEAGRGIAAAHKKGILHRDIKPQNVMVSDDGEIKVMDFGLAKFADASTKTRTGTIMGTPRYMSPEQALAKPLDARSDQYSYGIMVYRLLCGREPFVEGDSLAIVFKHVHDAPQPPESWDPRVPADLSAIVMRALAKNTADRWPDMEAMLTALEDYRRTHKAALAAGEVPKTTVLPASATAQSPEPPTQRTPASGIPATVRFGPDGRPATAVIGTQPAIHPAVNQPTAEHFGHGATVGAAPAPFAATRKPAGPPWGLIGGIGMLVLAGAGVGGWLLMRKTPEPPASVASAPAPSSVPNPPPVSAPSPEPAPASPPAPPVEPASAPLSAPAEPPVSAPVQSAPASTPASAAAPPASTPAVPPKSAPAPRPAPAGDWLAGKWSGSAKQRGGSSWTIQMNLDPKDEFYTVSYPSLGCRGILTLGSRTDKFARFREKINLNPDGKCVAVGVILLTRRADGRLDYRWNPPGEDEAAAVGVLHR